MTAHASTLTSLAMLKVSIDQGKDYLEYLRPFILQALYDRGPQRVTDQIVADYILKDRGLAIPPRAIQIVLKRIAKSGWLAKSQGVWTKTRDLPNPGITEKKTEAERHIQSIVNGLRDYRPDRYSPVGDTDDALRALIEFLSDFSIPCLKAYLRGTAIPNITRERPSHIVLVSEYVLYLQHNDPDRFNSFMVLVQGHMLANSLLCPDLINAPKTYKNVTFYLDTPLLIHALGLEGPAKENAIKELIKLLIKLGATVAAFSHSREELHKVITGAASYIDKDEGRGAIVAEARRQGKTKSDLILLDGKVDDILLNYIEDCVGIKVLPTPRYIDRFQIGEVVFEKVLDDEISYYNSKAKLYDINSVRSIYVLREGRSPNSLEKCTAVLVTSNRAFSRAAYTYGRDFEETCDVSSVITDFSLTNLAWLKAPMGAPALPMAEVLAYSYAALQPSKVFLDKFIKQIDELEKREDITPADHQFLRSNPEMIDELMGLTLGEESELTNETIFDTLKRYKEEIRAEDKEELLTEQKSHKETTESLKKAEVEKYALIEYYFWECTSNAKRAAASIVAAIITVLLFCYAISILVTITDFTPVWLSILVLGTISIFTLSIFIYPFSAAKIYGFLKNRFTTRCLKRKSEAIGFDLENYVDENSKTRE